MRLEISTKLHGVTFRKYVYSDCREKIKGQGEMLVVISEKLFVRRSAVRDLSWLQRDANCMAADSDAREFSLLRGQLTSESNICVSLRAENSKGMIC